MKRIVIIGGGISGLAAAHRLVELRNEISTDYEVTLLEASSRLGGVIQTENRDGFLIEFGPDSFISEKPEAIELARRIGLESHLIETNEEHRRSFVVRKGKLLPVPESFHLLAPSRVWPLLTSNIFSWTGKARIALDLLLPRGNTNGADDESLASFVRRRLGREALDRMAQPMVGGIYTADPEKLSLRATIPRFLEMERTHGSVIRALVNERRTERRARSGSTSTVSAAAQRQEMEKGESGARYSLFLTFDRGMQTLVDRIAERLPENAVWLNTGVKSLHREQGSQTWTIETTSHQSVRADAVCIALPAPTAAQLLRQTDPGLAVELDTIHYASTATINLAYRRSQIPHPLDGFGFVVPFMEGRSVLACSFSSVKFAGRAPEGHTLLRAFVGGALQPELLQLDESELIKRVLIDLRDLMGIEEPPLFTQVSTWWRSMPQYEVGHLKRLRIINGHLVQHPTLKLAGNAFGGVGIPDCIRSGENAAEELASLLRLSS